MDDAIIIILILIFLLSLSFAIFVIASCMLSSQTSQELELMDAIAVLEEEE